MTAVFSVFLLTLVTPTAAANGATTMSEGVPTIQVKEERRARRDALWLCRYMCVCATQRVLIFSIFMWNLQLCFQCVSHSPDTTKYTCLTHLTFAMHTYTPGWYQHCCSCCRLDRHHDSSWKGDDWGDDGETDFAKLHNPYPCFFLCDWRSALWRRNDVTERDAGYLNATRQYHGHFRCWITASLSAHGKNDVGGKVKIDAQPFPILAYIPLFVRPSFIIYQFISQND